MKLPVIKGVKNYYPLFLSIVFPGLGQMVKGQWKKGLLIFALFPLLYYLITPFADFVGQIFHNVFLVLFYFFESRVALAVLYIWQLIDVCITTKKDHTLSLISSCVLPGSGQLAKKQILKGLCIMIGIPIPFLTMFRFIWEVEYSGFTWYLLIFVFIGTVIVYIWQVVDVDSDDTMQNQSKDEKQFPLLKRALLTIGIMSIVLIVPYFVGIRMFVFPSSKQLSKNYFHHKAEFNALAAKITKDQKNGLTDIAIKKKYLQEGKNIGIEHGLYYILPDYTMFMVDTSGISISGSTIGYVYTTSPPRNHYRGECDYPRKPLKDIDAFEGCKNQSYTIYQKIDKNWYLYEDFED